MLEGPPHGRWVSLLAAGAGVLGEAIARQTGIRDYIAGEKVLAPVPGR